LAAAHEAGILHRDLKPENIFLEIDDEQCVQPKILDFGLAKLLMPGAVTVHKTRSGTPMGSPRYMSPEQCRGVAVDHRTDIYAFGCIVYRMLTGVLPFDAGTALELMMAHVSRQPAAPSQVSSIDGLFDEPLLKMLEKDPDDRPPTLLEAYESLVRAVERAGKTMSDAKMPVSPALRETVLERERTLPRVLELPKPRVPSTPSAPPVSAPSAPSSRFLPWALGVLAAAGLGTGVFFAMRTSERSSKLAPVASAAGPAVPEATAVERLEPPAVRSAAPEAQNVAITIHTQPPHAEIYANGALVGTSPGPVSLPQSDSAVSLVLKAAGHEPVTLPVKPSTDLTLNVSLPSKPPKASKTGVSRDLENPY